MDKQIPKAVKAEMEANFLKIQFDNGAVKYLRSHYNEDLMDAFSLKKGKGKRINLLLAPHNMWIGARISIENDGTVILNGNDRYSPQELWEKGREHISSL